MSRKIVIAMLAIVLMASMAVAQPATAQGGCKAFGQDTASLAQLLGPEFGGATSSNPDVSGFVSFLHDLLCNDTTGD